ncbi:MAG: molecular chaperone TorD family protein [Hyphomicrobiaceae bacterium]
MPSRPVLDVSEEEMARARLYNFIAALLSRPPTQLEIDVASALSGDSSLLGQALTRVATAARATSVDDAADAFQALFIGLGRGELLPYGSYYLTGFLQEKPLARLRSDLGRLGVVRDADVSEPEDHVASILEVMAGMIEGHFGPQLTLEAQKMFFNAHVASWMPHFFKDLEENRTSPFYAALGCVGARFLEVEEEAFRMI